jgi:hypothetical protein
MDSTWEGLLQELVSARGGGQYRTDQERQEAQIETFDYVLQSILEKLKLRDAARSPQGTEVKS